MSLKLRLEIVLICKHVVLGDNSTRQVWEEVINN